MSSKTIVFVHGLFLNGACWKPWEDYFSARGYNCHAFSYPYHEGHPEKLRKYPHPELGRLRFAQVIESLTAQIDRLPEKPILIGHSMGGLCVQKLLFLGKGVAAICISSAPPKGIFGLKWSFIRSNLPIVNPLKGNSPFLPSVNWYHYAIWHTAPKEEVQKIYDAYVIPESRNIPRTGIGSQGYIDFKKAHAPLLFISGTEDRIIPISLNIKNHKAYSHKNSICAFKAFNGRTHFICWEPGWEEIAGFAENWLKLIF